MKILVQKFGGTSVDRHEHRALAARKVIQAREAGFMPVVVVSAIGRAGAPYATDTLVKVLKDIDPQVPPAPREMDMMMACGEIISTVVFAHTLLTSGYKAIAPQGYEINVNFLGKAATWILYLGIGCLIVTHRSTEWPYWIFWTGLVLAVVAGWPPATGADGRRGAGS